MTGIKPKKPNKKKVANSTNKRDDVDWVEIGKEYCAGATVYSLSKKHKVSRIAIDKQIEKNQWVQDVSSIISKEVAHKVAGVSKGLTSEQKQEAIDNESDRLTAIAKAHQKDVSEGRISGSTLQSILTRHIKTLEEKARNGELDIKHFETVVRIYKNLQEPLIAAQEREGRANGIDLMPRQKDEGRIFTIQESRF